MPVNIFFMPLNSYEKLATIQEKIKKLYEYARCDTCFENNDHVALKIHFGEKKNTTHVSPDYVLPIAEKIKKKGGKPFLTDTNVLYKSSRSDAVSHLLLAYDHGFTIDRCGAPVIITDGLRGSNEIEVEINGKLFNKVSIATEAITSNALFVITHVTGHMGTGLGGAIKNLGMGLASRKGKLRQHSSVKPWIVATQCTACQECIRWCPEGAIELIENAAVIQKKRCIGCGECVTVCRFNAVKYNWQTSNDELQRKIAEHALGATIHKKNKLVCFNFLVSVTKDCDCVGQVQQPIFPDIGVLAGRDPVAIDKASLDLIHRFTGNKLVAQSYPNIDETIQLVHGQEIGLGSMDYQLIEIT